MGKAQTPGERDGVIGGDGKRRRKGRRGNARALEAGGVRKGAGEGEG